jgi:glycosyltransferase involved in cell wall biosynthesis
LLWNRDSIKETTPPADRLYVDVPLGSKKIFLYLPIWFIWCFWRLIILKPDAIHGCDIEGFLPGYFYSLFRRVPVFYDIHDVTTGKYGFPEQSLPWKLFRAADHFSMKRAAAVFVPDPERLDQLGLIVKNSADKTLIDKTVVTYNSEIIPLTKTISTFTTGKRIRMVYVGALNRNIRGVEFLLQAVQDFPTIDFDIAGMGADLPYFTEQFTALKAKNLTFWGRIDHQKAMELNEKADLMISLLNPEFENYRFASSTKIFEAMRLAKPIIVSNKTVSGRIVSHASWGEVVDYDYESLKKVLTEITTKKSYTLDGAKVQQYSWTTMRERIEQTYQRVLES